MGRPPGTTVFVGNISYETTEEQLKEVFSQVGNVLSFRLMYDHETGKAKGFGFCEYEDKETAMSARRNLNGTDLNGRALRVDLTENDKQLAAAASTGAAAKSGAGGGRRSAHPALQGGLAGPNPSMARMTPHEIHEAMLTLKRAVESNPNEIRELLLSQPMYAHAILQGQIMIGMVPPPPMMRPPPSAQIPPQMNPQMNPQMAQQMVPPHLAQPMAPQMQPQMPPPMAPQAPTQMAPQMGGMMARPGLMAPQMSTTAPPPQPMVPQQMGALPPQLRPEDARLLNTVMNMTPQQINMLPLEQRDKVLELHATLHSQQQQAQAMADMTPGAMRGQPPQRPYR